MIFVLLIGHWCRSSSWRWQPHIRWCRLHYPLPKAEMRFMVQFFSKCIFYMFLFGEKIENSTFLPFLTPQKRNLVGPSETIWPLFRIWGSTWLEPQIRKSNAHCCPRQNLKSGIPDLRFLYNVQWKWNLKSGKVTIPPQKWPNLVAKKVKMRAPKKRLSPNPYGHGHFAKNRIQIGHFWPLRPHLQSTSPL